MFPSSLNRATDITGPLNKAVDALINVNGELVTFINY